MNSIFLKYSNLILGLIALIGGVLIIIPLAIYTTIHSNEGFGFGLFLIPIYAPLSFSLSFTFISIWLFFESKIKDWVLKSYQILHILTVIFGIITCVLVPLFPTIVIGIPFSLLMVINSNYKTIELQLLIINLAILICELWTIRMEFYFGRSFPLVTLINSL